MNYSMKVQFAKGVECFDNFIEGMLETYMELKKLSYLDVYQMNLITEA